MSLLISRAFAATQAAAAAAPAGTPDAADAGNVFGLNMMLIVIMVVLFYVLLIMPQQKRFKKHRAMVDAMKKGDKVLTAAGFIGTVDKIEKGDEEVIVDLGNGVKVTALRSTLQSREQALPAKKADAKA